MSSECVVLCFSGPLSCQVLKVCVHQGRNLAPTQLILVYKLIEDEQHISKCHAYNSTQGGVVKRVLVKPGDMISDGSPILEYSKCTHPIVMRDMCAECGLDLEGMEAENLTAAFAMVHSIPELMISSKKAASLGKADEELVLQNRKLVLLGDLNPTLIHTMNHQIPPNIENTGGINALAQLTMQKIKEESLGDENADVAKKREASEIHKPSGEDNSNCSKSSGKEAEGIKLHERKIHVKDADDDLLYLEEILRTVLNPYYEMHDNCIKNGVSDRVPDMKYGLPSLRRKVLENVRLVFSGLIPTHTKLRQSGSYLVAKSLGAVVEDEVTKTTTHVVAARLGAAKVSEARISEHIHVVTPDWLWACAERWERVDERLYPFKSDTGDVQRKPSPGRELKLTNAPVCDRTVQERNESEQPTGRNGSASVNSLLFASSDEVAHMRCKSVNQYISEDGNTVCDDGGASYPFDQRDNNVDRKIYARI